MADYDLAIIGGGLNGVSIARDAAGRGLRVRSALLRASPRMAAGACGPSFEARREERRAPQDDGGHIDGGHGAKSAFAHPCISGKHYSGIVPLGMAQPGWPPGLGRRLIGS